MTIFIFGIPEVSGPCGSIRLVKLVSKNLTRAHNLPYGLQIGQTTLKSTKIIHKSKFAIILFTIFLYIPLKGFRKEVPTIINFQSCPLTGSLREAKRMKTIKKSCTLLPAPKLKIDRLHDYSLVDAPTYKYTQLHGCYVLLFSYISL